MKASGNSPGRSRPALQPLFAACFGVFLGITLLKFGNPPIFENFVTRPANLMEFVLVFPWPIRWAYYSLGLLVVLGLLCAQKGSLRPIWLLLLPGAWLLWQITAAGRSIDPALSWPTVWHFVACCCCFYLGRFCLRDDAAAQALLTGLLAGFMLVIATGFEQHFGGLEQARKYFYAYTYPRLENPPAEYLKKLSSPRIFATLFYPNALAGLILLLLPMVLCRIAHARRRFTPGARTLLLCLAGVPALACLVWSGSKGGWLLMLLLGLLALFRVQFSRRLKLLLMGALLLMGLAGFGLRYAAYFKKGGTSVVARFDYWSAALRIAAAHPLLGTGPGTFAKPYAAMKNPESEMARLTHNDYLEQACDSGWPGFALYCTFIGAVLVYTYPRKSDAAPPAHARLPSDSWAGFSLWLGVLGWALQGLMEFSLYIPTLAWPAFSFLGLLLRQKQSQDLDLTGSNIDHH